MYYLDLAKVFEDLEKSPSYLQKNKIIAELLKKTPKEEVEMVVLLLLGRPWPAYVSKETGVGPQQLKKSISIASGYSTAEVEKLLKDVGDFGEITKQLLEKRKRLSLLKKDLTVNDVFSTIKNLPEISGSGSVDKKINEIAGLLTNASPVEGKFIVRTVLGDLRVGVAEGRLRDALATAFGIEPDKIEHAYMLTTDYSLVAKTIAERGEVGLKKLGVSVGHPVSPMLAQRAESIEEIMERMKGRAAFEIKLDGIRIQTHKDGEKILLFTRRMENYTSMFPDMIEPLRKSLKPKQAIVDGELVAIDPRTNKPMPFQEVLKRRRKYDIERASKEIPVELHLFDVLLVDGKTLIDRPYTERRKVLEEIVEQGKVVKVVEQKILSNPEEVKKFADYGVKIGHEGLLAKELSSTYRAGRREFAWLKLKPVLETLDLVVVGGLYGKGKRAGAFGSYVLAALDEESGRYKTVAKCGSGYTDEDLEELTRMFSPIASKKPHPDVDIELECDTYFEPKFVFETAFEEIQTSPSEKHTGALALRFPRFVRLREDRRPEEISTMRDIEALYRMQEERKAKLRH
ncbi:MAG: ATP-dependent DNA ligase [Candidatus Hadarchaeales archaeon]